MEPTLSIILPVYNEDKTIETIVERIYSIDWQIDFEVIVIDDGSIDQTPNKLNGIQERYPNLSVIRHDKNHGKGRAIKTGLDKAKGKIIAIQDADLEYDPAEIKELIRPILEEKADVVYGSRFKGKNNPNITLKSLFANKFLTLLTNLLTGLKLTDMETCQKVIKRELLNDITIVSKGFSIEPEITLKLFHKRARFAELPVSYKPRTYKEGKKINWSDGLKAIIAILYFYFNRPSILKSRTKGADSQST